MPKDNRQKERPVEQPAVRTTIVGGRPPGAGKGVGEIPRGIEVLVKKASVDAGFRKVLLEKRADAAQEIGLALDPAEKMMLNAVPAAQLEGIIARTTVSPGKKRAFLGRAAAVMLAALGTGIGCDQDSTGTSKGIAPDRPKAEKSVATQSASEKKASTQTPPSPKASTQSSSVSQPVVLGIMPAERKVTTTAPSTPKPSTQAPVQKAPIPMPVAGAARQDIDYPSQPGAKARTQTPGVRIAGVRMDRPGDAPAPKGDVKPTTNAPAAKDTPPEIQRSVRGLRPMRDDNVSK